MIRLVWICGVAFHREALSLALQRYADLDVLGLVADVYTALAILERERPDLLVVDSPSPALLGTISSRALPCPFVIVGAQSPEIGHNHGQAGALACLGSQASLEEVHAALCYAMQSRKDEQATARGDGLELTGREREIVTLLARGYSNKEIAGACAISPATVKHHVHHILQKFNVQRRGQIAKIAMKQP